jgi:hypothetical protein
LALDTTRLANGALEVTVRAVDQQYVTQITLHYQVDNPFVNERPTVTVLTPRPAASVRGLVTLAGSAGDSDGTVASVEFRVAGGPWAAASLDGTSWSATLDTAGLPNGPLLIEVRSFDGQNYSEVPAVTVIVDNAPPSGGFLPGLEGSVAIAAMAALATCAVGRRRRA